MATIALQALEIMTPDKGTFRLYAENASQAFKKGELVQLSSGKVSALSGTDPALNGILGIVMEDSENIAAPVNDKLVFVPEFDALFVGNLGGTSVTAVTDIGTEYGLVEASDKVHVDKTDVTNDRVIVVDLDPRDAVGDTNGRVVFKFLTGTMQLTGQAGA